MKIAVVGAGYVGLVSAACFAESGRDVLCLDVDASKIERLRAGEIPIFEPGLEALVARNVARGRLAFDVDVERGLADVDVVFVAVGTPPRADGGADLRYVDRVAETVASHLTRPVVLVLKSTVPVGTNARVRSIVEGAAHSVHVVSNPEFLKEGDAIADFMVPDRVVLGCPRGDAHAREVMRRLYTPFVSNPEQLVFMAPESAELTKYVANTMLAMRISFMNEVALLCEKVEADAHDVRRGVGSDARIGGRFLFPGPGYGGSCFPKDVKALVHTAREHGMELELASSTDRVNDRQRGVLLRKLREELGWSLRGKRVAVWGLAFKPKTDDVRESPALFLIEALLAEGAEVAAHDPEATENARRILGERVRYVSSPIEATEGADALVLVTDWEDYLAPDLERIASLMRGRLLIDGRNIWSSLSPTERGFSYTGVGVRDDHEPNESARGSRIAQTGVVSLEERFPARFSSVS